MDMEKKAKMISCQAVLAMVLLFLAAAGGSAEVVDRIVAIDRKSVV